MGLINMPAAWDISHGGSVIVTVAVLDTRHRHGDRVLHVLVVERAPRSPTRRFRSRRIPTSSASRITGARDFAFWNGPVLDMVGHGTHVAGTILQDTNNNLGFAGMAYNARLMPVKVCFGYWEIQIVQAALNIPGFADPDDTAAAPTPTSIAGIRYAADNGAKVINVSLGGPGQSTAELDAIRYAVSKGAFVAMSGGNSFDDGNPIEYPAGFASADGWCHVGGRGRPFATPRVLLEHRQLHRDCRPGR